MSAQIAERTRRQIEALAERDQFAAALRDAGSEVRASEVGARVTSVSLSECKGACRHGHWLHQAEDGADRWVITRRHSAAGPLAALARAGLAMRRKEGGAVFWSWAGEQVDMTGIEDWSTPTEEELLTALNSDLMDDLQARGAEIWWVSEPSRNKREQLFPGAIRGDVNGPLRVIRVSLYEQAPQQALRRALEEAAGMVATR